MMDDTLVKKTLFTQVEGDSSSGVGVFFIDVCRVHSCNFR